MASKPAIKTYNPYAIKKIVEKTSMKSLAAQASAKAVAEVKAEQAKTGVNESKNGTPRVEIEDAEPDIVCEESSSSSRSRGSRQDIEDDVESIEVKHKAKKKLLPVDIPVKKGRLSKAEKIQKAAGNRVESASKKQREKLLQALNDAEEEICLGDEFPSVVEPPSTGGEAEVLKEQIMILWKHDRHKFNLFLSEPFCNVFEEMAKHMETTAERVLIFCNRDPSHTVNPLDTLNDIGKERVFLSAFRDDGSAEQQNSIPEAYRITFNVQSGGGAKGRTKVEADKRAPLRNFMVKYCQTAGINFENVCDMFSNYLHCTILRCEKLFLSYLEFWT
ncbi:hypothetical protein RvY_07110-2 [Ramazzottius varieornatus]|uniref:Uncharacterized protein n=1 Tax=Ramazzottius varieornatus TaxID=947166 RepID=A0A1D1V0W2_RAMVA|nr:hypothetical protein RvY_07110-2 [Ramazzottius varieornatus]